MLKNVFRLNSRSLLRLSGPDTESFLQGLISKDIGKCDVDGAVYSFLFNPKGRIQQDLFLYKEPSSSFLVECDATAVAKLKKTLLFYRLRKKVQIDDVDDTVQFSTDPEYRPAHSLLTVEDPRVPGFGRRSIVPAEVDKMPSPEEGYLKHRLQWGIPEGVAECGDQLPYQMNGDLVNAVSLDKGCYVGQELTARTYHTGVIRRRVMPFIAEDVVDETADVVDAGGVRRGKIVRSLGNIGLALSSLDSVESQLFIGKVPAKLSIPNWWPKDRR
uniref:GCV_T domain-containing protein n=1 Tax=Steinernema glaseri TaxID=37863 RepID=A0A1I8AMQ3_9BILA